MLEGWEWSINLYTYYPQACLFHYNVCPGFWPSWHCSSDEESGYVSKVFMIMLRIKRSTDLLKTWASNLLMAKGHACYCGLVHGLHVEK